MHPGNKNIAIIAVLITRFISTAQSGTSQSSRPSTNSLTAVQWSHTGPRARNMRGHRQTLPRKEQFGGRNSALNSGVCPGMPVRREVEREREGLWRGRE